MRTVPGRTEHVVVVGAGGNSGTLAGVKLSAASAKLPEKSEIRVHADTARIVIIVHATPANGACGSPKCDSIPPTQCEILTPNVEPTGPARHCRAASKK